MSIELVMPSNHLILCRPLLLLTSIFPRIKVFSIESILHIRWPKYWSFSISPSNEQSESISFRMDWLDLLAVQGTLKSLLQHHSSKASILQHSALFIIQLSHPYMTTGKTIALTGCCARITARPKRPHLGVCPGPNSPLKGRQGSRDCTPYSPGESGLASRGSKGLRSPLEPRRGSLGAH